MNLPDLRVGLSRIDWYIHIILLIEAIRGFTFHFAKIKGVQQQRHELFDLASTSSPIWLAAASSGSLLIHEVLCHYISEI